jgi:carboxypeptidase T
MKNLRTFLLIFVCLFFAANAYADSLQRVRIATKDVFDRTAVGELGVAIDTVDMADGSVTAHVTERLLQRLLDHPFEVTPLDTIAAFPDNMLGYHDWDEMMTAINGYATDFAGITKLFSAGKTIENRDIWCMKISNNPTVDDPSKPAILITANIHAREHVGLEEALDFTQRLLNGYGNDEYATWLINHREIFIVFMWNADGAVYDVDNDLTLSWRKNRHDFGYPDPPEYQYECNGVDLNRNFSVGWSGPGGSGNSCDETYYGSAAFSEPESQVVRDLTLAHDNIVVAIDLHTYQGLVLYPWGYQSTDIPEPDLSIHKKAAQIMAVYTGYTAEPASDLYLCSGTTIDYWYGELGIKAFTIEMTRDGFYPPDTVLPDLFNIMWPTLTFATGIAEDPSMVLSAGLWKLTASADGTNVTIGWSAITNLLFGGKYEVARSDAEDGTYTVVSPPEMIQASPSLTYSYVDQTGTPETTFWYKVLYHKDAIDKEWGPVQATTGEISVDDDTAADDTVMDDTADDTADDTGDDTASDDDLADDDSADDDTAADDAADDDGADDDVTDDDSGDDTLAAADDDTAQNSGRSGDDDSSSGCGC